MRHSYSLLGPTGPGLPEECDCNSVLKIDGREAKHSTRPSRMSTRPATDGRPESALGRPPWSLARERRLLSGLPPQVAERHTGTL